MKPLICGKCRVLSGFTRRAQVLAAEFVEEIGITLDAKYGNRYPSRMTQLGPVQFDLSKLWFHSRRELLKQESVKDALTVILNRWMGIAEFKYEEKAPHDEERSIVLDMKYGREISAGASLLIAGDTKYQPSRAVLEEVNAWYGKRAAFNQGLIDRLRADLDRFDNPAVVMNLPLRTPRTPG